MSEQSLQSFGQNGLVDVAVDLSALDIKGPETLSVDSANGAVWLGHKRGMTRLSLSGAMLATVATRRAVEAIGVAPLVLTPTVSVLTPAADQTSANPMPELKLGFGATCHLVPCNFGPDYFLTYRLSATLNGHEVGHKFTMLPGTANVVHTPESRLPEGQNTLNAKVTDSFGQPSEVASHRFFIDTTPPALSALSPSDGALLNASAATVTGSLSEAANIRMAGPGALQSAVGTTFSFPFTLSSGTNLFTLVATDLAGNSLERQITYILDTIAPVLSDLLPEAGVFTDSPAFTITGSADELVTFSLSMDGVSQSAQGRSFSFTVNLSLGLNVFTLVAIDLAGNQTLREVKITRREAGISVQLTAPVSGAVYSFPAEIQLAAEVNSESMSVQRVEFLRNGEVVAIVYNPPFTSSLAIALVGSHVLQARAVGQNGARTISSEVRVDVLDTPARAVRAAWDKFGAALVMGAKDAALAQMSLNARSKFAPVFQTLGTSLAAIVQEWSAPLDVLVNEDYAQLAINRVVNGQLRLYFVYLVKGADSAWQIEEM